MGFFQTIGHGFKKAYDWVFQDEEKLRKVKSSNYTAAPAVEVKEPDDEEEEVDHQYDAWEEIDNLRMNMFLGSWATKKFKGGVIGEDKVKKDLERLEKKRAMQNESARKESLQERLEKIDKERQEKQRQEEKQN